MLIRPLAMSRTGNTNPHGKLVPLPRIRVADATDEALRKLASAEHMPVSEFVRVLLEVRVHGESSAASIAMARIRRVAGSGPAIDTSKLN